MFIANSGGLLLVFMTSLSLLMHTIIVRNQITEHFMEKNCLHSACFTIANQETTPYTMNMHFFPACGLFLNYLVMIMHVSYLQFQVFYRKFICRYTIHV